MGTGLALDGFVIEILKPNAKDLNGQEVGCFRNRKGFWGLILQLACDANAKVRFVQTDWPGATNDITCFRGTQLFNMLKQNNYLVGCTSLQTTLTRHYLLNVGVKS